MSNQTGSEISNTMVDAFEIIADKIIEQAQFDKTIVASVVEAVDTNKGKYKVKYQDSNFYAFVDDTSKVLAQGAEVYVLIPKNDFSLTKKILGSVKDLSENWSIITDAIEKYEDIGINIIEVNSKDLEWSISSYKGNESVSINIEKDLVIRNDDFKHYLSKSDLVELSAEFLTDIDNVHVMESYLKEASSTFPNFGLKVVIENNGQENQYILSSQDMEGNPFNLLSVTKQKVYFKINSNEIKDDFKIKEIYLFEENFKPDENKENKKNIFVRNISIKCVKEIPADRYNTYSLRISAPEGEIIKKDTDRISLIANVVFQGSISKLENTSFYWGKEDIFVNQNSTRYNQYLGAGWSYIDNKKQLYYTGNDIPATTRFKCVAVYEGSNKLEDEITIKVPAMEGASNPDIKITSSAGQYFYNGEGNTTLTVETSNIIDPKYQWIKIDNLKNILFIGNEKSIKVSAKDINRSVVYKCGVKDANDVVQGTASLEIYNLTRADNKNISLYNGNQTFLYDLTGKSPCLEGNAVKQVILPLSFDYYDDTGKKVPKNRLSISWKIPKKNSMLKGFLAEKEVQEGDENYYILNTHDENVSFVIQDFYSANYLDNDIILEVVNEETSDKKSVVTTNFTFLKQGESGTNGTNIYGVIDLKISDENGVHSILSDYAYPTLEIFEVDNHATLNNYPLTNNPYFEASLYQNGEVLSDYEVEWSIVKDVKDSNSNVSGYFTFLNKNGNTTQIENVNVEEEKNKDENKKKTYDNHVLRAVITKDDKDYFVEMPIVISLIKNTGEYLETGFKIKENSGFNKVMYAADGTCPQYSMTPFEYEIKDGYEIVVSSYHGASTGNEKLFSVTESDDDKKKKMFNVFATSYYYGTTNDSGVKIDIYKKEDIVTKENKIAEIFFPIYLYLNKFGYSALNGWDGNSIQINEDENYILSPQIGAGRKNKVKNTFTGLLMGEMTNKEKDNDIGLLGFSEGVRTIFLDAQTGKAVFGSEGKGQIILDPYSEEDAIIKSGNYKDRIVSKDENGDDVVQEENKGFGMKINLSEPYIKWGNENFSVNKDGLLKCVNATVGGRIESDEGCVGGWNLTSESFYSEFLIKKIKSIETEEDKNIQIPKDKEVKVTVTYIGYPCLCNIYYKDENNQEIQEYEKDSIYWFSDKEKTDIENKFKEKNLFYYYDEKEAKQYALLFTNAFGSQVDEKTEESIEIEKGDTKGEYGVDWEYGTKEVITYEEKSSGEGMIFRSKFLIDDNQNEINNIPVLSIGADKTQEGFDFEKGKMIIFPDGTTKVSNLKVDTQSNSAEPYLEIIRGGNCGKMYFRNSKAALGFGVKEGQKGYIGVFSIGLNDVSPYKDISRTLGKENERWKDIFTYHLNVDGTAFIGSSLKMKDPEYGTAKDTAKKRWKNVLQLKSSPNNTIGYYGSDLLIGAGQRIILGSGESHTSVYDKFFKNSKDLLEGLFLTSDSSIRFYANCNNINNHHFIQLKHQNTTYGLALCPEKNGYGYLGSDTIGAELFWRKAFINYIDVKPDSEGKCWIKINGEIVITESELKKYALKTDLPTNILSGKALATEEWVEKYYQPAGSYYSNAFDVVSAISNSPIAIATLKKALGLN